MNEACLERRPSGRTLSSLEPASSLMYLAHSLSFACIRQYLSPKQESADRYPNPLITRACCAVASD